MERGGVILTRPAGLNETLAQQLRARDVPCVCLPALALTPTGDPAPPLQDVDLIFFASGFAAQCYVKALGKTAWPSGVLATGVGAQTLRSLRGVVPEAAMICPPGDSRLDSEALWQTLEDAQIKPRRVLIVRGQSGRDWLRQQWQDRGVAVQEFTAYHRAACTWSKTKAQKLTWLVTHNTPCVLLITSQSGAYAIDQNLQRLGLTWVWQRCCVVTVHARVKACVEQLRRAAGVLDDPPPIMVTQADAQSILQSLLALNGMTAVSEPYQALAQAHHALALRQQPEPHPSSAQDAVQAGIRGYNHGMTENTNSTACTTSADDSNALVPVQDATQEPAKRSGWRAALLVLAVAGLILVAGAWFGYQQFQTLRVQWSAQVAQSQAAAEQARTQAQRALEALQTQTAQLAALLADQTRTAAQVATLQADQARSVTQLQRLAQTVEVAAAIPSGTDSPAMLLDEVGRLVEIAQQFIRLEGSVGTALMALERAQTRLAGRSEWAALARTLQDDVERLRAAPVLDVVALASQLDALSALLGQAPLLLPETSFEGALAQDGMRAADAPANPAHISVDASDAAVDASWWGAAWRQTQMWSRQAWQAIAQDVRGLIEIRRVGDATALLISPDQAAVLRDTLQHRVAAARLALLMRQPALWMAELTAVRDALATRFDGRQAPVQQAQALVRILLDTAITMDLPALDDSVRAVQAQRDLWSRAQQDVVSVPASEGPDVSTIDASATDGERS